MSKNKTRIKKHRRIVHAYYENLFTIDSSAGKPTAKKHKTKDLPIEKHVD